VTDLFRFTDEMSEVTGFGGIYESYCRAGICTGAEWCAQHPNADLRDIGTARELTLTIFHTILVCNDGSVGMLGEELTLPQTQLIADHVLYIAAHGWNDYEQKMARMDARERKGVRT
jgi:hypothetical protein